MKGDVGMIARLKDVMGTSKKLEELSAQVDDNKCAVTGYSKEMGLFRDELRELKTEIKRFASEAGRFSETAFLQLNGVRKTNEDLKSEVYDFKMLKSDLKSKVMDELIDGFRDEMRKETSKIASDVTRFNELKDELSIIVTKFKSVESEIDKFKLIAQQIKTADFQLQRHARELEKNDSEKLKLMQENDNLKRLLAKERRGRR